MAFFLLVDMSSSLLDDIQKIHLTDKASFFVKLCHIKSNFISMGHIVMPQIIILGYLKELLFSSMV